MATLCKLAIADNADTSSVDLPKPYLDKLKQMFEELLQFFEKHNITYWIDGGTLLGCYRDKSQISWDDDIDLGMDIENYNNMLCIINDFETDDYKIRYETKGVLKIVDTSNGYTRNTVVGKTEPRLACIDIFMYKLDFDEKYTLFSEKHRELFQNCIYDKNDLFPLTEYNYEDLIVKGPKYPENYLTNTYGNYKEKVVYLYL
jgi:phosphorylcholine metabolism protein LicD